MVLIIGYYYIKFIVTSPWNTDGRSADQETHLVSMEHECALECAQKLATGPHTPSPFRVS
jgi:hypothetical protein